MESLGDILRRRQTRGESPDRELARKENIARAERDFGLGPTPGFVSYIRELKQRSWEANYDIASLLWELAGIQLTPRQTFDTWLTDESLPVLTKALEAVRSWARFQGKPFLTLAGPPGVGKTHLALAACQSIVARGDTVMYRHVGDLLDRLRRATLSDKKEEVLGDVRLAAFLVLDDLGVEKLSEWGLASLDEIVDARYSQQLNLLVCTNARSEDLPPRIADRLADKAIGQVIELAVPSFRRGR